MIGMNYANLAPKAKPAICGGLAVSVVPHVLFLHSLRSLIFCDEKEAPAVSSRGLELSAGRVGLDGEGARSGFDCALLAAAVALACAGLGALAALVLG